MKRLFLALILFLVLAGASYGAWYWGNTTGYDKGYSDALAKDTPRLTSREVLELVSTDLKGREPITGVRELKSLAWPTDTAGKSKAVYEATYKGDSIWLVHFGLATFTVNERTTEVKP